MSLRLSIREQLAEAEALVERLRNKLSIVDAYEGKTTGTIGARIVAFLDKYPQLTFAPSDVAQALRIKSMNTIQKTMQRLVAKRKIHHWGYANYHSMWRRVL